MKKIFFVLLWLLFFGSVMSFSSAQTSPTTVLGRSPGIVGAQKMDVRKAAWEQQEQQRMQAERSEATYASNQNYCDFLNSVARTDPHRLYNFQLEKNGIVRSGAPGTYHYEIVDDQGSAPVTSISWVSAARYVNWLEHHQIIPASDVLEDVEDVIETGAYTLEGDVCISINQEAGHLLPKNVTEVSFANFPDIGTWGSPDLEDPSGALALRKSDAGITMEKVDAQLSLKNVGIRFITTSYYLGEARPAQTWLGDAELVGEVTFGVIASLLVGRYIHERWCGNEGRSGMSPVGNETTDPYEIERQEKEKANAEIAQYQQQGESVSERRKELGQTIKSLEQQIETNRKRQQQLQQEIKKLSQQWKPQSDTSSQEEEVIKKNRELENLHGELQIKEHNLQTYEKALADLGPPEQITSSTGGAPIRHNGEHGGGLSSGSSSSSSAAAAAEPHSPETSTADTFAPLSSQDGRMQLYMTTHNDHDSSDHRGSGIMSGTSETKADESVHGLKPAAGGRDEELQRRCEETFNTIAVHQRNRGRKMEAAIIRSSEDLIEAAKMDVIDQHFNRGTALGSAEKGKSGTASASTATSNLPAAGSAQREPSRLEQTQTIAEATRNSYHCLIAQKGTMFNFRKMLEDPTHDQTELAEQIKALNAAFEEIRTGFKNAITEREKFYEQEQTRLTALKTKIEEKRAALKASGTLANGYHKPEREKLKTDLEAVNKRLERLSENATKDASHSDTRSETGSEVHPTAITRPRKTPLERVTDDLLTSLFQDRFESQLDKTSTRYSFGSSIEALMMHHVSDSELVGDVMSSAGKNFSQADHYLTLMEVIHERIHTCGRLVADDLRSVSKDTFCHPERLFDKMKNAYRNLSEAFSHLEAAEEQALYLISSNKKETHIDPHASLKSTSALIKAHLAARALELKEAKAICDDYLSSIEAAAEDWRYQQSFGSLTDKEKAQKAFYESLHLQAQKGSGSAHKKK